MCVCMFMCVRVCAVRVYVRLSGYVCAWVCVHAHVCACACSSGGLFLPFSSLLAFLAGIPPFSGISAEDSNRPGPAKCMALLYRSVIINCRTNTLNKTQGYNSYIHLDKCMSLHYQ